MGNEKVTRKLALDILEAVLAYKFGRVPEKYINSEIFMTKLGEDAVVERKAALATRDPSLTWVFGVSRNTGEEDTIRSYNQRIRALDEYLGQSSEILGHTVKPQTLLEITLNNVYRISSDDRKKLTPVLNRNNLIRPSVTYHGESLLTSAALECFDYLESDVLTRETLTMPACPYLAQSNSTYDANFTLLHALAGQKTVYNLPLDVLKREDMLIANSSGVTPLHLAVMWPGMLPKIWNSCKLKSDDLLIANHAGDTALDTLCNYFVGCPDNRRKLSYKEDIAWVMSLDWAYSQVSQLPSIIKESLTNANIDKELTSACNEAADIDI